MSAMVNKLNPDFVVCGPCFNFEDYADMAANISSYINEHTSIKSCAMMSIENKDVINEFKDKTLIVKMPKKGGTGLNDSITNLCMLMESSVLNKTDLEEVKTKVCY